jgi:transposase-like protein
VSLLQKEWEAKLELIASIARSQAALARILGSVADVSAHVGVSPETLQDHVRALTSMQRAILKAVTGVSWRPPVKGKPASPWLVETVKVNRMNAEVTHR